MQEKYETIQDLVIDADIPKHVRQNSIDIYDTLLKKQYDGLNNDEIRQYKSKIEGIALDIAVKVMRNCMYTCYIDDGK